MTATPPAELNELLEDVDPSTLVEHPLNDNRGDVPRITRSIEAIGWYGHVIAQHGTRRVLAGWHASRAAIAAGMATVPVVWVDVPDDVAAAIVATDNETARRATRDPSKVAALLAAATSGELGADATGYDDDDLARLLVDVDPDHDDTGLGLTDLDDLTGPQLAHLLDDIDDPTRPLAGPAETDPETAGPPAAPDPLPLEVRRDEGTPDDETPEPATVDELAAMAAQWAATHPGPAPISRRGDLWQLGPHRLICEDCTVDRHVSRLLDGATVDLMLTDPPYCSGGFQEGDKSQGSIGSTRPDLLTRGVANDLLSTRGYQALMRTATDVARPVLAYVFTDWRMWSTLSDVMESVGFRGRAMIVWDKITPGLGMGWRAQHELILHAVAGKPRYDLRKGHGNVLRYRRTGNKLHPTQKPVDLLRQLLDVCDKARTVYDPFTGSGSTLIACHEAGDRTFYGAELDPLHVDTTLRRWQQATGLLPARIDDEGNAEPVDVLATTST